MSRFVASTALGLVLIFMAGEAEARAAVGIIVCDQMGCRGAEAVKTSTKPYRPLQTAIENHDARPSRWCGWWLRHHLGVADRAGNLARWWASFGAPAHGPAPGVIAVWRHHVGVVKAVPGPGRIVLLSGNDGHAVRERERSARGVIAWRVM